MKIGFVGMSHLGVVSCIGSASKSLKVIGFDSNVELIKNLEAGKFPINEPDLVTLFESNRTKIEFTSNLSRVSECDLIYISLDVATDDKGHSSLSEIEDLISSLSSFINKDSYIIILSQVPPGFSRKIQNKLNINLAYQVETLVFGNALERFLAPERFIVGLDSSDSFLNSSHKKFLELFECKILTMSYESAELAKISINVFLASSITSTNTLCELAEKLGADWGAIKSSLQLDRRIGEYGYVEPGLGISGGNIERDIRTANNLAKEYETESSILESIEQNSRHRKLWPSRIIVEKFDLTQKNWKIAIWGLAYKKGTHSIKNSPAVDNMKVLSLSCTFNLFDSMARLPESNDLPVLKFSNILDTLNGADALIIFNDSNIFANVPSAEIRKRMNGNLVIDPFNVLDITSDYGFDYFTLGKPAAGV